MQELTEKGMVFDRFAVAYGNKKTNVIIISNEFFFNLSFWLWVWFDQWNICYC